MQGNRKFGSILLGTALPLIMALQAGAASAQDLEDLMNMSLDSLTDIEVTSVSKKAEKASEAPSAIFVITQDDIRRMGATSIPEALRLAPGIQVAKAGSHQWAITARGFNDQFANKLLVLLDGRTIYTPLFSGVFWDVQDTVMEDIDRIEVIRGPGATLWGANAVNGVINIITKHSKDTQDNLVVAGAGNYENAFGTVRHGGKAGDNGTYRAYLKHFDRDDEVTPADTDAGDKWQMSQGGFRADWTQNTADNFTFQGDVYGGTNDNNFTLPTLIAPFSNTAIEVERVTGGNLIGRWGHKISDASETSLQVYYDFAQRENVVLESAIHTLDIDFQHNLTVDDHNEVTWGAGYRAIHDDLNDTLVIDFTPDNRTTQLFSAFVQDKIPLIDDKLFLTLGSKFEHNDYTGFEVQPSGKLSWLIDPKQSAWASISRAVRTPARANSDVRLATTGVAPAPFPGFIVSTGNPNLESEELIAYEAGYRIQPRNNLSFDLAAYYNDYDNLFTSRLGTPTAIFTPFPYIIYPVETINGNAARSYGAELAMKWNVTNDWQLAANYTYLNLKFDNPDIGFTFAGKSPKHQFNVMSTLQLPHDVEMNNMVYTMDDLTGAGVSNYVRFDTRLAWTPTPGMELSVVGQNLLDDRHAEFSPFIYGSAEEVGRSVFGKVTWQF